MREKGKSGSRRRIYTILEKRNFRFYWQTDIFISDFSNRVIRIKEEWFTPYKNSE